MGTRVDLSACTALAVCSCGWRGEATGNRAAALAEARAHRARAHAGDAAAAATDRKRAQRARQGVTRGVA